MVNSTSSVQKVPDVYIDYILCKHFGWTPDELDRQDEQTIEAFIEIISQINIKEAKELEKYK